MFQRITGLKPKARARDCGRSQHSSLLLITRSPEKSLLKICLVFNNFNDVTKVHVMDVFVDMACNLVGKIIFTKINVSL